MANLGRTSLTPTADAAREPVSIGAGLLALIGIEGASTAVAGLVGSVFLVGGAITLDYSAEIPERAECRS